MERLSSTGRECGRERLTVVSFPSDGADRKGCKRSEGFPFDEAVGKVRKKPKDFPFDGVAQRRSKAGRNSLGREDFSCFKWRPKAGRLPF